MKENYSYWKKPWSKWVFFAAGVLQLLCLWMSFSDYRMLMDVGEIIFDAPQLRLALNKQIFKCLCHGMSGFCFFGLIINGVWATSKRKAQMGEGILLMGMAVAWGASQAVFRFVSLAKTMWLVVLIILLVGGAYYIWRSTKEKI